MSLRWSTRGDALSDAVSSFVLLVAMGYTFCTPGHGFCLTAATLENEH